MVVTMHSNEGQVASWSHQRLYLARNTSERLLGRSGRDSRLVKLRRMPQINDFDGGNR